MGNLALPNSVVQAMTIADSLLKLAVMLAVIPLISVQPERRLAIGGWIHRGCGTISCLVRELFAC